MKQQAWLQDPAQSPEDLRKYGAENEKRESDTHPLVCVVPAWLPYCKSAYSTRVKSDQRFHARALEAGCH